MLPDFGKRIDFCDIPKLRPFVLVDQHIDKQSWKDTDRENRNTPRNFRLSATLSITHLTSTDL